MRSSQSLTRRIVPAVAVAVVSTLVLGAVVVTADAATGDGSEELPRHFGVATPMDGDAWAYNVTLQGGWTFGLDDEITTNTSVPLGQFQWAGRGQVRGGDGRMHDANLLFAEHLGYEPLGLVEAGDDDEYEYEDPYGDDEGGILVSADEPYWYEASGTGWVLAGGQSFVSRGAVEGGNESYTNTGLPFTNLGASTTTMTHASGLLEFPQGEVPCFAFNALQGANVSLQDPVVLFAPCTMGGRFVTVPEGLAFTAKAVETVGEVQAIRFDARFNGLYQAWFTPSVPYPVKLAFEFPSERPAVLEEGDLDLPTARAATLTMSGFTAGALPLDSVDDPADAAPAPELVWAPTLDHGIDDAGFDHPFPLSRAYQVALTNTLSQAGRALSIYLSGHPDAYMAAVDYDEQGTPDGYYRTWRLGLTDGREPFGVSVSQHFVDNAMPVAVQGAMRGSNATVVYEVEEDGGPWFAWTDAPGPELAPRDLPTAASLAARWAAFDGSGTPANRYGFVVACAEAEEEACRKAEVTTFAGHSRFSSATVPSYSFGIPGNPWGTEQMAFIERIATFGEDGNAQYLLVQDERVDSVSYDSGIPVIQPPQGEPSPRFEAVAIGGLPANTWMPEPEQAAQIGFLGVVVGFLYWIWPKLGVVGLFSRLERGELLDHPARARLMQIVESQPGIHFHDLAVRSGLANGTAVHHLRKLADSGHVSLRRSGRYTCYFPGARVDPRAAAAAPLLKSDGARLVLETVRARPGLSNLELATATGLQPSTVNYHVQRLARAGLVSPIRDGRSVRLHPGPNAGLPAASPPGAAGAAA